MRSLKIIYAVFCSLLVMGCCLSASGVNVYDTSKDARSVIGNANYDSSEEGTRRLQQRRMPKSTE